VPHFLALPTIVGSSDLVATVPRPLGVLMAVRRCTVRTADGTPWAGRIWLTVNGVVKQDADLSELIWPVPDIISILSRSMELKTGRRERRPAVGAIVAGDKVTGGIDGLGEIDIMIGQLIARHSATTNIPRSRMR
jgi:Fumarylacetoacetate (FAA) hydrolase family